MWFNNYAEVLICKIQKNTVETGRSRFHCVFIFYIQERKLFTGEGILFLPEIPAAYCSGDIKVRNQRQFH